MDTLTLIVTPVVSVIVGFAVWYFQSRLDALRREKEQLADDRRRVYAEVLDPFIRMFAGIKNPKEAQKAQQQVKSFEYRRSAFEVSLVGADTVVRAFNDLWQHFYTLEDAPPQGEEASREMMRRWGEFLLEIRRSLGNADTKLEAVDMLRSQISDIDRILGGRME